MKPSARREVVGFLRERHRLSQRTACRLAGFSRQAMRYQPVKTNDAAIKARLWQLGEQYPRYGYLLLHAMLKSEGLVVNRKKTYRL